MLTTELCARLCANFPLQLPDAPACFACTRVVLDPWDDAEGGTVFIGEGTVDRPDRFYLLCAPGAPQHPNAAHYADPALTLPLVRAVHRLLEPPAPSGAGLPLRRPEGPAGRRPAGAGQPGAGGGQQLPHPGHGAGTAHRHRQLGPHPAGRSASASRPEAGRSHDRKFFCPQPYRPADRTLHRAGRPPRPSNGGACGRPRRWPQLRRAGDH